MRMKRWPSPSRWAISTAALLVPALVIAASDDGGHEFRFFKSPTINFWGSPAMESSENRVSAAAPATSPTPPKATGSFKWEKYLSPQHDEFFREGDYVPPAPFLEIARNPSDENIENWFRYIELRNQTLRRVQERLSEFAARHGGSVPPLPPGAIRPGNAELRAQLGQVDPAQVVSGLRRRSPEARAEPRNARRFRIRMYFDSKCPHCERMMETLATLAQRGYYVELRQVDPDIRARSRIPFPVQDASGAELTQYGVTSVPVLVVGDFARGTFFKIQGYQTPEAVLRALAEAGSPAGGGDLPKLKPETKQKGVSNEDQRVG